MKNLAESEIIRTFEERRLPFTPYGFTCEAWRPKLMERFDRHNEVEINFVPSGRLTYLIHDRVVSVPAGRVALFWGLYPHRIISADGVERYYVMTIPLGIFLRWRLSASFIDCIMKGRMMVDSKPSELDAHLFKLWHNDLSARKNRSDIVRMEVECRIRRLESSGAVPDAVPITSHQCNSYDYIERMAMFVSSNYDRRLTVGEVAASVGLNPDYANSIFRRAFGHPISEHIAIERIAEAQRRLVFSADHISTIAYGVGYESLSSFNRAFRKLTGLTPRGYRAEVEVAPL